MKKLFAKMSMIAKGYLYRVAFCFLLIFTVVLTSGKLIYQHYYGYFAQELHENYQKSLSALSANIDDLFYSIVKSSYMISENSLINEFLIEDNFFDVWKINKISELLGNYKIIQSDFIKSVLILDEKNSLVITNESIYDMDLYFDKIAYSKDYHKDFYVKKNESAGRLFDILKPTVTKNKIDKSETKVIPIVFYKNTKYSFKKLLVITIDVDYLCQFMSKHTLSKNSNVIMYNNDGDVFSSAYLCDNDIKNYIEADKENLLVRNKDNVVIYYNNRHSILKYFKYMAIIPNTDIEIKLVPISRAFYFCSFICLLLVLVISFFMTRDLYNQIKRLMRAFSSDFELENGAHKNEFRLIEENIKKVIYNNTVVNARLSSASLVARDSLFEKILIKRDYGFKKEELINEFKKYGVIFKSNCFAVSVIEFSFSENFMKTFDEDDRKAFYDSIIPLLSSFVSSDIDLFTIEICNCRLCLIFNVIDDKYLPEIEKIIESFYNTFSIDGIFSFIRCGIGEVKEGINNVYCSYSEAISAFSKCSIDDGKEIRIYKPDKIKPIVYITSNEKNKLYNYLISGKIEEMEALLSEIKSRLTLLKCSNDESLVLYLKLYSIAQDVIKAKNLKEDEVLSVSSRIEVNNMDLEEFEVYTSKLYTELVNYFASNGRTNLASDVLKYIEEHYDEDLFLDKLAKEFAVSSRYISRVFKAHTNVGFVDYLNEFRVSKAIELLLNSDCNVDLIARKVGFNSRNTFYRVFKNSQGITPTQYRNKFKKQ